MFPLLLRIPIRPDPFPHASPIRPLPELPSLTPIPGRGTIHHSLDELSDCRRGFSSSLSLSLFFRSIPNYFRGGEAKSSAFRSLFKSCFCFRPFPFYSWVVDIKAYTEGLVVERGLKFRSKECREILGQRVYTRTQTRTYTRTQAERNNRGCGSGTRSDLAIFPPRPVSNRQSGSALVH